MEEQQWDAIDKQDTQEADFERGQKEERDYQRSDGEQHE